MSVKGMLKDSIKTIANRIRWIQLNLNDHVCIGNRSLVRYSAIQQFVKIGHNCNVQGTSIGRYSYIGNNCDLPQIEIGMFCSIASNVKLAAGNHPMEYLSLSPYTYSDVEWSFVKHKTYEDEYQYVDNEKQRLAKIGNDVWIGTGAILVCSKKALQIGNGAVVGAGAVVIDDVPPYAVVVGCPAKIVKYRFSENMISQMEKEKWWEKGDEWIRNNVHQFNTPGNLYK